MIEPAFQELLEKRRDRAIATILGVKERDADRYLPPDVQRKLRKTVLDELNGLVDLCADLLGSASASSGGFVINELYLQKLDDIHSVVTRNGDG